MNVSIIYHNSVISFEGFLQKEFFLQTQHNLAQRTFTVKHMILPQAQLGGECVSKIA